MMKITLSYTDDTEIDRIMELLKPVMPNYRIKSGSDKNRYKHLYLTEKKHENPHKKAI